MKGIRRSRKEIHKETASPSSNPRSTTRQPWGTRAGFFGETNLSQSSAGKEVKTVAYPPTDTKSAGEKGGIFSKILKKLRGE